MSIQDVTLEPEVADLVSAAFDRSWQFVKTDPELAHVEMDQKRAQLSRHLNAFSSERGARPMAIGEQGDWRATSRTKHRPVVLIFSNGVARRADFFP